ncbi:alpha/beta hydrolase [Kribbella sp. NBC_01245]|uniref:alpha/beta fold hydrolase n=1 Tax=Kribbella sp. NBC_01245 TaxID=2903578 RepID=UPI002E2E7088|nr:alpha/beta hydrolase [Kribbella sp. NBC_01245]
MTTVVLVHGAFADSASWNGVIERLLADGTTVVAPPNHLRGLSNDAAYLKSFVKSIEGPVLLVGHSYGGAVISAAAAELPQVVGLVYIAAFVPEKGESLGSISAGFPETPFGAAIRPSTYPLPDGTDATEVHLDYASYPEVFAADLPASLTKVLAVGQRPIAVLGLEEALAVEPAWKNLPSWDLVATQDNAIHPEAQRSMAKRAGATTIEVAASHAVAVSQPDAVTGLIRQALAG